MTKIIINSIYLTISNDILSAEITYYIDNDVTLLHHYTFNELSNLQNLEDFGGTGNNEEVDQEVNYILRSSFNNLDSLLNTIETVGFVRYQL